MSEPATLLAERLGGSGPSIAVVLGSGATPLVDTVEDPTSVPFTDLPGFPPAEVAGHAGRFVSGTIGGVDVVLQAGRYHRYEGRPHDMVVAPMRLLASIGVEVLVMTNAVGGIRRDLEPGDLVLLDDQINLTFDSPLIGPVAGSEERFPDMSAPFDRELSELTRAVAHEQGLRLGLGTYAGVLGPSYETAAEVSMLARFGADVVGMSTVPEVLAARALGMRCVGLSVVTNRATGRSSAPLSHEDVLTVGKEGARQLTTLIAALVPRIDRLYSTGTK